MFLQKFMQQTYFFNIQILYINNTFGWHVYQAVRNTAHNSVTTTSELQLTIQVMVPCTLKFQQLTSTQTYDKVQHTSRPTVIKLSHRVYTAPWRYI